MTAGQLHALLHASLELWQVQAVLQAATDGGERSEGARPAPLQCRLLIADGLALTVAQAAPHEEPFRWWLLWHGADAATDAPALRRKPCASTLGLLRSLREALGVPAAARVRVGAGAGMAETGAGPARESTP